VLFPEILRLLQERGGEDICRGRRDHPDKDIAPAEGDGHREIFLPARRRSALVDYIRKAAARERKPPGREHISE
jgi:hypothetical protein